MSILFLSKVINENLQLWLCIVPLPQCTKLDSCLDWQTIHGMGAVNCYKQNVLCWERDQTVLDTWVRILDPVWHLSFRPWSRHFVSS
jgi:hypothetical protein